jgi:hypothetical protein
MAKQEHTQIFANAITAAGYRLAWRKPLSANQYDSRTADKFVVRLPDGLRADIEVAANVADRSMNSVFVQAVRQYLDGQNRQTLLLDALANAVAPLPPAVSSDL